MRQVAAAPRRAVRVAGPRRRCLHRRVRADPQERLIGRRYRIAERLGAGGMGTVWAGTDELLGRRVALKEVAPPPGLTADEREELVERTRREARAAARVASPAVMTVFDVLDDGESTWLVLERLPPRSLADVLREEGPMPPRRAAEVGLGLLAALEAAHAAGVLHRDVKPANVMRAADGRTVLADFGIARSLGDASITRTGLVLGSPAYLAPERARGGSAVEASDLWGLGATLFTAVEGAPPFGGGDALSVLMSLVADDVPPAPHAGPLRPAIEGLLVKDPAERLSAGQVRPLLEQARDSPVAAPRTTSVVPVTAPPPTSASAPAPQPTPAPAPQRTGSSSAPTSAALRPAGAREVRGRGRRRAVLLAVAAVAVLALVIGGLAALQGSGTPGASATAGRGPSAGGEAPRAGSPPVDPTSAAAPAPPTEPAPPPQPAPPPASTPGTGGDETGTSSASSTAAALGAGTALPAGLVEHVDETGFRVGVPEGWTATRQGAQVRFSDPSSSAQLRIDQTDEPKGDPLADWQAQEPTVAGRLDGYRRIAMTTVEVPYARAAADWEFTHGRGTHVLDRNLLIDDTQAYALYWSAPEAAWEQSRALFDVVATTFQPAP